MKKNKLKKEHHLQIYKMCSQRLKKHFIDAFYKDEAIDKIIHICLSHMKYKQIVEFYDVLEKNGLNKY